MSVFCVKSLDRFFTVCLTFVFVFVTLTLTFIHPASRTHRLHIDATSACLQLLWYDWNK